MRNFPDWLQAFVDYSDHLESPRFMRFWGGVSALAGALRKKVWIENFYFRWTPNFFIIFVAPPGIVTKSTTADVAMELLRQIPGIHFGPNSVTWQSLVSSFSQAGEFFQYGDEHIPMSAITLVSRELGSLINPKDNDVVNLFIELWDGAKTYEKQTKMSGNDLVEGPWVNLIGATTPSWIANNVPAQMLGGGFISRCVFLYADRKDKFVAHPGRNLPKGIDQVRLALIQDLEHISLNLVGPYSLTPEADAWEEEWYEKMWRDAEKNYTDDQVMGYLARKQTHVNKLAMILSASKGDSMEITYDTFRLAETMMADLEPDMQKVFAKIGRTDTSLQAEKLLGLIGKNGGMTYELAYRQVHTFFPTFSDFEGVLTGLIRSGQVTMSQTDKGFWLKSNGITDG